MQAITRRMIITMVRTRKKYKQKEDEKHDPWWELLEFETWSEILLLWWDESWRLLLWLLLVLILFWEWLVWDDTCLYTWSRGMWTTLEPCDWRHGGRGKEEAEEQEGREWRQGGGGGGKEETEEQEGRDRSWRGLLLLVLLFGVIIVISWESGGVRGWGGRGGRGELLAEWWWGKGELPMEWWWGRGELPAEWWWVWLCSSMRLLIN